MPTKDLFSDQSKAYAAFRPTYPQALFDFIFQRVNNFDTAWDCATGNGQVARDLCKRFKKVYATDISQQQLDEAFQAPNIDYSISKAEQTPFPVKHFDLITVGQALHWINTQEFYTEVNRVGKPGGTIAVWGYSLLSVNPEIDKLFNDFYFNKVGSYWDAARKLVENEYSGIDFPFSMKAESKFQIIVTWSFEQFAGYLTSWSATQKFIKTEGFNPVPEFMHSIRQHWQENTVKEVRFPVFIKTGSIA
ncbi:MAG TPA: class I SAM-dependent methyltransferase [Sphingobacteriaceae bacterium]